MKKLYFIMVLLWAASSVFASDIKKVTGIYTYFAPETMSIEKAKSEVNH